MARVIDAWVPAVGEDDHPVCSACTDRGCGGRGPAPVVTCVRHLSEASVAAYAGCDGTGVVYTTETHKAVPCPNCGGRGQLRCRCAMCHPVEPDPMKAWA
jgi:hypothetical protein